MSNKIILIGGGGHCKSVIDVIESSNEYIIEGIIDKPEFVGNKISGYNIIGSDSEIEKFASEGRNFHITIGSIKSNSVRVGLYNEIINKGGKFPAIISSKAHVSRFAKISDGSIIMHNVVINSGAFINKNCIINTGAVIEHDVKVGNNCHISTGVFINGDCTIGDDCFIGSNSTIIQGISIAKKNIIGAGSVVLKNTKADSLYIGVPAMHKKYLL